MPALTVLVKGVVGEIEISVMSEYLIVNVIFGLVFEIVVPDDVLPTVVALT